MTASAFTSDAPELITATAAARILGVSPYIVGELADAGEIPYFRMGRHKRFLESDLRAYLARSYQPGPFMAGVA